MNDSLDPILQQQEQRKLREQLVWRLAVAAILVGGVLGMLAWLDQGKEQKPQLTVAASRSAGVAPPTATAVASSATASTPVASSPSTLASTPAVESIASTPVTTQAIASAPVNPESRPASTPVKQISAIATPSTVIATHSTNKPATSYAASPVVPVKQIVPTHPVITSEKPEQPKPASAAKSVSPMQRESSVTPPKKLAQQTTAPTTHYPPPVSTPNGYAVQAGVFLHTTNAEKMLRVVQSAGVPAYLETRVQIGPFNNKTEADIAVQKLRKLGLEPIVKTN